MCWWEKKEAQTAIARWAHDNLNRETVLNKKGDNTATLPAASQSTSVLAKFLFSFYGSKHNVSIKSNRMVSIFKHDS